LIDALNPGPQLSLFASHSGTEIGASKGHIPLGSIRRRHHRRQLSEQIPIGIAVQEQRPLLGFCQGHIAKLHLLHSCPGKLRLDRLLERLDIYHATRCPRQGSGNFHLPVPNWWSCLRPG
jgi:hypothetical protein